MSRTAQLRAEDGQIIPPLIVVMAAMLVFGLMMLQVGLAADFKSRAQTAADAAALAGAVNVKLQIETSSSEFVTPGDDQLAARLRAGRHLRGAQPRPRHELHPQPVRRPRDRPRLRRPPGDR